MEAFLYIFVSQKNRYFYFIIANLELMKDMGIHPGINGLNGLPFMDYTDPDKIDILLISHFHLDHCGGLPWFLTKTQFKGRVFMTYATKAIYRWLLSDYIKGKG